MSRATTGTAAAERRFLTPQDIAGADDRPTRELEVAEWGGWVRLRALSLDAYLDIKEQTTDADTGETDERKAATMLLQAAIVDEDGDPLLTMAEAEELRGKSSVALGRIMLEVGNLSQTGEAALRLAQTTFPAGS